MARAPSYLGGGFAGRGPLLCWGPRGAWGGGSAFGEPGERTLGGMSFYPPPPPKELGAS
jgi:hypothetical protein